MKSEFSLIDEFLQPFDRHGPGLILGPGDDGALTALSPGMALCTTVDALVEGVHFLGQAFRDEEIGHKALAINLSDLAAMGALPRWFVCSVACPADAASLSRLPGIARGMAALARRANILLIGGNFTRAEKLSIHITAMGEVPADGALRRDGVRAGDLLFVSGALGGAALALDMMLRQEAPSQSLRQRQCAPSPRLELGLLARQFASAAMDISDGLLQELDHLCQRSQLGFDVDLSRVPLDREFVEAGAPLARALSGGEDYELLLAVPQARARAFAEACAQRQIAVSEIGRARRDRRMNLINAPGRCALAERQGFDHFGAR